MNAPRRVFFARFDLFAVLPVIAGLLIGVLLLGSRGRDVQWKGVSLSVPETLNGRITSGRKSLLMTGLFSASANYEDRLKLFRLTLPATVSSNAVDPVLSWRQSRSRFFRLYREIDGGSTTLQGKKWIQFEYAFVVDPDTGSPGQDARPPVVVRGLARVVRTGGPRNMYVLTYQCDSHEFKANLDRVVAVFDSLVSR